MFAFRTAQQRKAARASDTVFAVFLCYRPVHRITTVLQQEAAHLGQVRWANVSIVLLLMDRGNWDFPALQWVSGVALPISKFLSQSRKVILVVRMVDQIDHLLAIEHGVEQGLFRPRLFEIAMLAPPGL